MMAWRCSGSTNAELVDNLVRGSLLQTPRVIEAFKRVDRRFYVQDKYEAYQDSPSYIGCVCQPSPETELGRGGIPC